MPIEVQTPDDERIAVFRDVRDKDLRGRERLFMAESELVLRRLLRDPDRLHALLLSPGVHRRLEAELQSLPAHVEVYVAPVDVMTAIAGFHIHRGVLAAGRRPAPDELTLDAALGHLKGRAPLRLLVAEGLTNVDNLGGLFRNAAAFGVDGVLLAPDCCDPLYRKAIRVSMGHVLSVPWAVATSWPEDLERLRSEWGIRLVAAEVTPESRPLPEVEFGLRSAIVLGAEGSGLRPETIAACDAVGMIPMAPGVPSLNVAVASGVFLYELDRSMRSQSCASANESSSSATAAGSSPPP